MTHKDAVFNVLLSGEWVCFRDLLKVYYKYTQRIKDYRDEGFKIQNRPCEHGNKHADDYKLTPAKNPDPPQQNRVVDLSKLRTSSTPAELFTYFSQNGEKIKGFDDNNSTAKVA